MFGVWALSPRAFGVVEPWDTPYPVYATASLLGGATIGLCFPRRLLAAFLGAWSGQAVALLLLPGHDAAWLPLGLVTTGIGSALLTLAAALGSWLRVRSSSR